MSCVFVSCRTLVILICDLVTYYNCIHLEFFDMKISFPLFNIVGTVVDRLHM